MALSTFPTPDHLLECHDCGTFQRLPPMPPEARATCPCCDATLRHTRLDSFTVPLALNITALLLFLIGAVFTLMSVSTAGQVRSASLLTGPEELGRFGLWELSVVVLATTVLAPLGRILCMIAVLGGLRQRHRPPAIRRVFAWVERLRPWSMVEILLLGLFVAYVRLGDIARVDPGPAVAALAMLTVVMLAADTLLDRQAVWEALDAHEPLHPPDGRSAGSLGAPLGRLGCDTCGLVTRGREGTLCPRCGFSLHHRRPGSINRAWALVIASLILYLPANLYPILTVVRLGAGEPSTIMGGVRELLKAGMWPLALLVFMASVVVPVLKLAGLILLLATTQMRYSGRLRDRTVVYRVVDAVGRWSMIDIFMESILVSLVQFGAVVTVRPGMGAVAFSAVVILTMLAARAFDPRLIWDRAEPDSRADDRNMANPHAVAGRATIGQQVPGQSTLMKRKPGEQGPRKQGPGEQESGEQGQRQQTSGGRSARKSPPSANAALFAAPPAARPDVRPA